MKPVSIGIIGCGVIANAAHLPAVRESELLELAAVCDIIPEKARAAADTYGAKAVYTAASDLLADEEVEAVILALPSGVRTPLAYKALAYAKHVLVEKPSASHVREIDEMRKRSVGLTVGFCSARFGFTDSAAAAAACIRTGALGDLRIVRCRALLPAGAPPSKPPPPWRQSFSLNGGGILTNWGCYDVDYLLQVVGDVLDPIEAAAQWWPVAGAAALHVGPEGDADSHYAAAVRCRRNILLSLERGEFTSTQRAEEWCVIGDNGTLRLDMLLDRRKELVLDRLEPSKGVRSEVLWEGTDPNDITVRMLEDFAGAIREKRSPRTGFDRARIIQQIFDGIYLSAAEGRAVEIGGGRC